MAPPAVFSSQALPDEVVVGACQHSQSCVGAFENSPNVPKTADMRLKAMGSHALSKGPREGPR
eukprot:4815670-Alexandrium_andersonii.AAC.1